MKRLFIILYLFISVSAVIFAVSENEVPKLAISLLENPQSDNTLAALCDTATDNIELFLRLSGLYRIERLDFLVPKADLSRAELYFKANNYDNAVFGEIIKDKTGQYRFVIYGWEREKEEVIVEVEKTAESIFDIFDVIDQSVIEFIEKFSGQHIGFGRAVFINDGTQTDYSVYVDGNLLGENLEQSDVLYGNRTFEIMKPGKLGDELISNTTLYIEENQEYEIHFELPEAEDRGSDNETLALSDEELMLLETGTVRFESEPEGADVYLNKELLGTTPFSLFNVVEGEYAVDFRYDYYFDESMKINVLPNVENNFSAGLKVSPNHPQIRAGMTDMLDAVLLDLGITTLQAAWVLARAFGSGQGFEGLNYFDMMVAGPKYGLLLGGEPIAGTIMSLMSMWSYIQFSGVFQPVFGVDYHDGGALYGSIIAVNMIVPLLYDIIATGFLVEKRNDLFLKDIAANGLPENTEEDEAEAESGPLEVMVAIGGGSYLSAGVSYSILNNWLSLEQLIGLSSGNYTADTLSLTTSSRVSFYPWPNDLVFLKPYMGAVFNLGTDFASAGWAAGCLAGIGVALPWFELFFEGDWTLINAAGTSPAVMAAGVKI